MWKFYLCQKWCENSIFVDEDPNDPQRAILVNKLREDESILKQFSVKLKSIETCREELVSHLKESLKQQVRLDTLDSFFYLMYIDFIFLFSHF